MLANKYLPTRLLITLLFLLSAPVATYARDAGLVEALQMPAWLERNGTTSALKAGMFLQSGDVVSTGENARLLLRLQEGSYIKLGENARLDLSNLQPAKEEQGFFEAVLNVIKGAFRFTTSVASPKRRNVSVKIGSITAGIRGTDIWGSATEDKDILCLIEGKITAQREGEPSFDMQDPLSFYIVPKNQPAMPVQPVPEAQLAQWAAETELLTGGGIITTDGPWAVNLISLNSESSSRTMVTTLNNAGYAAEVKQVQINNLVYYRIHVSHFKTYEDAKTFADTIDGSFDIRQPWIVRL